MLEFGGAIGIDFGTENSRVSVMLGDEIHVITNDQGNITTPSYVTIIKEEKLIGDASKNQMIMNPNNTIFGIKRMIGRNFTDIKGDNNFIQIEDNETLFTPKQIVALIFSYLKNLAEQYLLKRVSKAVISVPYYFNDLQRLVIEEAASLAGLKVLRIINEPTAAALAYNLNKENNHINILVFDFGTNLTISVLNVDDGLFEIKENINFPNLKSEEFEERMVQVCCKEFELKYKKDLNEKSKAIKRLKLACERAKKNLSFSLKTKIELDCLMEGIDFEMEFTKEEFEQLNMDLFKKFTLEPIEQVLKEIKLSKEQIDKVIMVGGSSHIPKLQEMLNNYFDNCKMCNDINPDEVIVHGTAIQASNLTNTKLSNVLITFITPLSLGIETNGGLMRTVIERNTWYPCKKSIIISTEYDNQTTFPILIYEGERVMTKDNHLIGEFNLEGIFSAPKGIPLIEITFDINVDGVLRVSAKELTSGVSNSMIIDTETSRLSSDEICAMIETAEMMKRDEKRNNNQLLNNSEDVD